MKTALFLFLNFSFFGKSDLFDSMTRYPLFPALLALLAASVAYSKPLNVVFYLIDDMGWMDIGANGSDYYQTPHIDRLAGEGMRFTNGYAACNVCTPTRASVMTGKYPARMLMTQWLPSGRWDAKKNRLREGRYLQAMPLEELTIAEALREEGYSTAFMGKWHLGPEPYYFPRHQGFDVNVGGRDYGAPGSYWYPYQGRWKIPTTDNLYSKRDTVVEGEEGDYLIDRIAEEGEKYIRSVADKPFFLMMSHYGVHTPLQGKPDKVAKYEAIPEEKRKGDPRYAAMVESIDDSVGRIVATLEDLDLGDHTMIIFTSDNGGHWKATQNAPLRANKGSNYEGGLRVPVIIKWPGKTKPGSVSEELVYSGDFYPTILSATGAPMRPLQHLDGVDLTPALTNSGSIGRDALFWHYPHYNQHPQNFPASVIRKGDWKLIEILDAGELELYNLESDLGETTNLAKKRPEKTKELYTELEQWRAEVGADPMRPNPDYEGK